MYGSYNLLKIYFPEVNTNKIAKGIIDKLGIDEIENQLGTVEYDDTIQFEKSLEKFRER